MKKLWKQIEIWVLAAGLFVIAGIPVPLAIADMTTGTGDRLNQRNRLTTAVPSETATRKYHQIQASIAPVGNSTASVMTDDRELYIVGENLNIAGTTEETVWDGSTSYAYGSTATAFAVECVSDSNTDSKTATGVNSVTVWGLNGSYALQQEDVYLYGQNPKWTTGTWIRIFGVKAKTYGTGLTSVGNIYVGVGDCTTGVPATIYAKAPIGVNKSSSAVYTVPADMYASITGWGVDVAKGDEILARLVIRPGGSLPDQGFHQVDKISSYQMPVNREGVSVPIAIADEGSDIEIRASGDVIGTSVTAYMKFILRSK